MLPFRLHSRLLKGKSNTNFQHDLDGELATWRFHDLPRNLWCISTYILDYSPNLLFKSEKILHHEKKPICLVNFYIWACTEWNDISFPDSTLASLRDWSKYRAPARSSSTRHLKLFLLLTSSRVTFPKRIIVISNPIAELAFTSSV